jgi:hypothetical protein
MDQYKKFRVCVETLLACNKRFSTRMASADISDRHITYIFGMFGYDVSIQFDLFSTEMDINIDTPLGLCINVEIMQECILISTKDYVRRNCPIPASIYNIDAMKKFFIKHVTIRNRSIIKGHIGNQYADVDIIAI